MKKFDLQFLNETHKTLAGVDEAGRGPLAGPVVAAAVVFPNNFYLPEINDSKKLSEIKRNYLFDIIKNNSLAFGIGIVSHTEIDKINILQASLKAMKIAVSKLKITPDIILIDGNKSFHSNLKIKTIVKGDSKSFSIAAASILAKVTRDKIMEKASDYFPQYEWKSNKGYPTKRHREILKEIGPSPLHRKTFLKKILINKIDLKLF